MIYTATNLYGFLNRIVLFCRVCFSLQSSDMEHSLSEPQRQQTARECNCESTLFLSVDCWDDKSFDHRTVDSWTNIPFPR